MYIGHRSMAGTFRILSSDANILRSTQARVYPSPLCLSPFLARRWQPLLTTDGRTAAGWKWGLTYLRSLGAHWFPFAVRCHSASLSGSGFFFASHILLTLDHRESDTPLSSCVLQLRTGNFTRLPAYCGVGMGGSQL